MRGAVLGALLYEGWASSAIHAEELAASGAMKEIMAQALQMGDDLHNRNAAATSLLIRGLAPGLLRADPPRAPIERILTFVDGNNHFLLNLSMATCKGSLDTAHGVEPSSVVSAMSRNGIEFGIRVSGLGARWFTAPVPAGLYFPGYSEADANPDLGDSAIMETAGMGGFAVGAAGHGPVRRGNSGADPGLHPRDGRDHPRCQPSIPHSLPQLHRHPYGGSTFGRSFRTGICPVINTGIAHREPGVGRVGAGIVRAPLACFEQALLALAARLDIAAARMGEQS